MGLHKLSAGDGYTYLTRQVAAADATDRGRGRLADYYAEKGESPGHWMGAGLAGLGMVEGQTVTEEQMVFLFGVGRDPLTGAALGRPFPIHDTGTSFQVRVAATLAEHNTRHGLPAQASVDAGVRAAARTEVGNRMFAEKYDRPPADARELAGFIATASRQPVAVAGYDLTFSPVKSVSTLWALADRAVAFQIRAAHDAAVEHTLGWLEREVAFTRVGPAGVRQVPVRGLVAAAFTHRDSRAGDPDLHTHVAVANKVQTDEGRWYSLDGRVLYAAAVTASEHYNTRLEAELVDRLGVRFIERPTGDGKRPVREIAGVNSLLNEHWSSRRRDIDVRRGELASEFQTRHGRPPTTVEAVELAQQATLETREAKHEPRSEADQRRVWRRDADIWIAGSLEVDSMLDHALPHQTAHQTPHQSATPAPSTELVDQVAGKVTAELEGHRATWRVWHVRAEASRQVRAARVGLEALDDVVDLVVARTLVRSTRLGTPDPVTEPAVLLRPDGVSVYDVHGATWFTSTRVLAAEEALVEAAQSRGGRVCDPVRVGIAVAEEAANGITLDPGQAAMVRALATSGARVQLALAPAGTGKTITMRVLANAWCTDGGYVLGLAPSARAATELGEATDARAETLAKLAWTITHEPIGRWPGWIRRIGARTLVVVDEAGQASTTDLAAAVDFITGRGGSVRLVGDNQQLAAVGAGGVLRDIDRVAGAVTLSEVRRFSDPAEAAATLALRGGDATALGFYADHARIHLGDLTTSADQAYAAWAADRAAGTDSVLLAPTRELVTGLNQRARTDRLTALGGAVGREVNLGDDTHASTGDIILTRRNARRLVTSTSNWVKNGDRWTIEHVDPDGSLKVRHLDHHRTVTLPAQYVADHVQLGYATTVHTAQGLTTDTAHLVLSGNEPRQLLYVGMTRGRHANHVYLGDPDAGETRTLLEPDALRPPTAIETLTRILERDGSQTSATSTRIAAEDPATQLHDAVLRYRDALGVAAEHTLATTMASLDQQIETIWPGLTTEPAYPTLRGNLALHAVAGADPLHLLLDAAQPGGLGTAHDRAAVLDWRLSSPADGPLPWLPAVPVTLANHSLWGSYLTQRTTRIEDLAAEVRHDLTTRPPQDLPAWAHGLDPTLCADLGVWRAAFDVPATEGRPTGPPQHGADAADCQRRLQARVRTTDQPAATSTWQSVLPEVVTVDPHAETLARRLNVLDHAGHDTARLIKAALAEPRPLPVEQTAGALWWRISRHIEPVPPRETMQAATRQETAWAAQISAVIPAAETNLSWPRLLNQLQHAHADGYDVPRLITDVLERQQMEPPGSATSLVSRIRFATDRSPREPTAVPLLPTYAAGHDAHDAAVDPMPDLYQRPSGPTP